MEPEDGAVVNVKFAVIDVPAVVMVQSSHPPKEEVLMQLPDSDTYSVAVVDQFAVAALAPLDVVEPAVLVQFVDVADPDELAWEGETVWV